MKTRDMLFLFAGGALAFIFCVFVYVVASTPSRPQPNVPTIAGQHVPAQEVSLNFSNRYDFHTDLKGAEQVFQDCKLVGFTGETTMRDNGFSSGGYDYFQHWVVLEDRDGRRIYLGANDIQYIEDATIHQK